MKWHRRTPVAAVIVHWSLWDMRKRLKGKKRSQNIIISIISLASGREKYRDMKMKKIHWVRCREGKKNALDYLKGLFWPLWLSEKVKTQLEWHWYLIGLP